MNPNTVHVLLVEDYKPDAELLRRSFQFQRIANPLHFARDGVEALSMLRGEDGFDPVPRPFVILLDLKLPRMDGIEFLEELRRDAKLCDSVVFVLTASSDDRDKTAAYQRQIAGYVVKSNVGDDFAGLIEIFQNYWRCVELPPERTHVTD